MEQFLRPITEFIFGPSLPILPQSKLDIYPLFGPMAMCFFSKTHAPFTIVLNEFANQPRTIDDGMSNLYFINKYVLFDIFINILLINNIVINISYGTFRNF